ncbi:hypothetical protein ASG97_08990 [Bacillus sp. Soil745]|uniref:hypothetical protein n=1 Tax=Peribacillus frigoritolerans TaxID=450367 RepID=UPI00070E2872|nr:hypothetical protein [Peribacillus frigoritolerans]KRF51981.1 hypothetical protein ASG97_08990 [Bacillus sp. Soil745]MED3710102.1 hypothetical protein [Peribacillus frigoritolerans]
MITQTIEVKKVFVTDNQEQWIVFEEEMQAGFQYKLATIDDLHDYVAGTGEVFTYNVETLEGVVQWHEEHFSYDSPVDYICEYRVIN